MKDGCIYSKFFSHMCKPHYRCMLKSTEERTIRCNGTAEEKLICPEWGLVVLAEEQARKEKKNLE